MPKWLLLCLTMKIMFTQSKLVVYSPQDLIEQFKDTNSVINANYANFGHIPYGHSLIGKIYYDQDNMMGCQKMNMTDNSDSTFDSNDGQDVHKTKILLVDRGECSFVTKVRNAERAGASLVVVVDNKAENITNVVMGDDGTGTGIRIPSMLIGKEDGLKLKYYANNNDAGTLSAEFNTPMIDGKVHVELWYSSNNRLALDFIKAFDKYIHQLEDRVDFEPRFVTWACPFCSDDYKAEECFGDGKYCAPNHDRSTYSNIYGRDIISEDLRQHCLHNALKDQGKESLWWDYIKFVHSECFGFISGQCSRMGHKKINMKYQDTVNCVSNSFDAVSNKQYLNDNSILRENAQQWYEYGTLYWPSVTIDRLTFRGDLTPENILEAVCASLNVKPDVCIQYY